MLNLLNWIQDQHDVIPVKLNSLAPIAKTFITEQQAKNPANSYQAKDEN